MAGGWYVVSLMGHLCVVNMYLFYALGAADPVTHKIYIWEVSNDGQFASALDGGREPLIHVHVSAEVLRFRCLLSSHFLPKWHPFKSSIASTTNQGKHPYLALSHSRAVGRVCRRIRRG